MRKFLVITIIFLGFTCLRSQCTFSVATAKTVMCQGEITQAFTNGMSSYLWLPGNYTTSFVNLNPTVTTNYTIIGYNYSGTTIVCSDTNQLLIQVVPLPNFYVTTSGTIVCSGDSTLIFANGAQHYLWAPGTHTTSSIWAKPSATMNYTIMGWNSIATKTCNLTKEITIVVDECTGLNELKNNNEESSAFPNPFYENINMISKGESEVIIYNTSGKALIKKNFIDSIEINTLDLESGIYLILLKNKEGTKTLKMVKD